MMNSKHTNPAISRHILLLPLLFLLSFLYPWQVQHHARHRIYAQGGVAEVARPATKGQNDATQQLTSTLIGAATGGGTGATTALQGEKYNRQLHQMEIKLIRDNAAAFARKKGISLAKAREMLAQAALHNVDSFYAGTKVDPDAERFIEDLARSHGGTFKDNQGRTQYLFDERGNAMYNRHAVNANTIFDPQAQDLYRSTGYNPANIARSIAKSGQLQDESAATQKAFIAHAVDAAKSTGNAAYRDAAIRATVDARRNGVVDASYDTSTPVGWAMDQNLKDLGRAVAVASVGNVKSNGNVIVRLANGKRVEVPKEALVKGKDGRIFVKDSYKAPKKGTGNAYTVYKRNDIDLDKPIIYKDPRGKTVTTTNRELMSQGKAPYVYKNGKYQQVQLHHSRQNAQGPLFEVKDSTHRAKTGKGGEALHPYKTQRGQQLNGKGGGNSGKSHPHHPVDRTKFNKDREQYWKDRLKDFEKHGGK